MNKNVYFAGSIRGGRADAGQHAHRRAQRAAHQGPQQVDRRAGRHETVQQLLPEIEVAHVRSIPSGSGREG